MGRGEGGVPGLRAKKLKYVFFFSRYKHYMDDFINTFAAH